MEKKKNLEWRNCSEEQLANQVRVWLESDSISRSVIFLEGTMGMGKSTFVRDILRVLSPKSTSQGSPTFPLVQAYKTKPQGEDFYHIDLYRLKSEDELADSGIETQIEELNSIACVEWASLFPDAFAHWFDESLPKRKRVFLVRIEPGDSERERNYSIQEY